MDNTLKTSTASRLLLPCNSIFILLLTILLASCSSHISRRDGAPKYYVDESKVSNAVPKIEPLAKYGNMPWYNVFGKRYYTMKSSKNYEEIGVASWYGTMFHARRTSSGERYNMLAMTAAHKTLPLPTYVEVTNLKNHRQIIVKVNDRGPFESNRIIDLSYVAAKKLGMLGHGTATVRVRAIDPDTYGRHPQLLYIAAHQSRPPVKYAANIKRSLDAVAKASIINTKSSHVVYLQVGAFRNRAHAEKLQRRLMALLEAPR